MRSAAVGCLLGTAVGDAIGLPYEAISPRRAARLFGPPDRHRFAFGRGMVSDDTEHTCIVAQALAASGGEPEAFARSLAWGMRWWLLGLPAGIGFATLRATVKLWLGFPPRHSGVFSAGNGPAMRSALLGAAIDDPARIPVLVRVNTRITHTDPKAEQGALAVALAAHLAARGEPRGSVYLERLRAMASGAEGEEMLALAGRAVQSAAARESTREFARALGLGKGVSGYVFHTVPVCLQAWLAHPGDFRAAVMAVIECGGDTDTAAAIVGGILGGAVGREGLPAGWVEGLLEWPRTVAWMERLGATVEHSMEHNVPRAPPRLFGPWLLARNAFFTAIVLGHVLRRCLPPY